MGHEFFGGRAAVGKRMKAAAYGGDWWEVVGVVADQRFFGWDATCTRPLVSFAMGPERGMAFVVRTKIEPMSVSSSVRQAIWSVDKDLPFTEVQCMD